MASVSTNLEEDRVGSIARDVTVDLGRHCEQGKTDLDEARGLRERREV
jgi:hypothetical protein